MQESRLFRIVYYLLKKGKSTAAELSEKFEVSIRTIYRDIDVLSSVGIPIYATQGKGGGISILENFVLDKSLLSTTEQEQILMALQGMIATEGKNSDELLTKLGGLFCTGNTNWIEVDFSNWVQNKPKQDSFNSIKQAIFDKHMISFFYFSSNKEFAKRTVEPIKLIFKSKDWYLYGYCLLKNDFRLFKLTRIKEIEILSETFTQRLSDKPKISNRIKNERLISVKLKFDKAVAFRVYDEFLDNVTKDENGNLYVQTNLPDNDVLYSYLFSFSDYVEVIEPEHIRQRLRKKLMEMQKKYET